MSSVVSSLGLGSGIDINSLVSKLVAAEQTPLTTQYAKQTADVQAKVTALGTFKSALSTFQTSLLALSDPTNFNQVGATSSDSTVVTASATSNADVGNYQIQVNQLAQRQGLASGVYKTVNDVVGTGTLTVNFGTYQTGSLGTTFTQNGSQGTLTLTIGNSNDTLSGIRDAINNANAGVSAAIVNSGNGYQLVLQSTNGGAKNAMQVTGISGLQYDATAATGNTMTQTQAAQDAQVTINGLAVTSTSNSIGTALKGVTLNLQKAQPGSVINVGISKDNSKLTTALQDFVKNFNDLQTAVKSVASYDPSTQTGGPLLGDATVLLAMSQIRTQIDNTVPGLTGGVRGMRDLGLTSQSDGTLALDTSKLNQALASNPNAVAAVFTVIGVPSGSGVQYVSSAATTQIGTYAVNVTSAATQGVYTGQLALTYPITLNSINNTFSINVDGASSAPITLTPGVYNNAASLSAALQAGINGDSSLHKAGVAVSVSTDAGNHLVITSNSYGKSSQVSITQGSALLGLVQASGTAGTDIAGTIDGQVAQGSGQQLTSVSGPSTGLMIMLTDNLTGNRGGVTFTQGLVGTFSKVLVGILDPSKGSVATENNGLQKQLTNIQTQQTNLDTRMKAYQKQLLTEYSAMDSLVGQLQNTSNYLTQQLSGTQGSTKIG